MIDFDNLNIEELNENDCLNVEVSEHMDIAIIGMSLKAACADNVDEFWRNLKDGRDCISDFPERRRRDSDALLKLKGIFSPQYGVGSYLDEIDEFDYSFFQMSPKEAGLMHPNQRLFLQCVWNAIEDAGYGGKRLKGSNTGVYIGHSIGTLIDMVYDYSSFLPLIELSSIPMAVPGNLPSMIGSRISYLLDFHGPSMLFDTACSSSLVAIHYACMDLRNHKCDVAIAGAAKINLCPITHEYKMGIESSDGRAKTFDDSSDGTGRGEGIAAIVLKPLKDALRDKDNVYAVIKGSAVNQDGRSIGITAPNAQAQQKVILEAWKDAEIDPRTISYIEAHGTGTELGDPIEIDGLTKAFSNYTDKKQFCAIGALKTNIGHLDNAAGIFSLIKCVLALKNKQIPPSLHLNYPNRKIDFACSPVYVNRTLSDWEDEGNLRRCGINSFGLSGTNCHVILEEMDDQNDQLESTLPRNIFTLSAKSDETLKAMIKKYNDYLCENAEVSLENLCYSVNVGRGCYSYRLAIIAEDTQDLWKKLQTLLQGLPQDQEDSIFYSQAGAESVFEPAMYKNSYQSIMNDVEETKKLCLLYVKCHEFSWEEIYGELVFHILSVPAYEFSKTRCWLEVPDVTEETEACRNQVTQSRSTVTLKGREETGYTVVEETISTIWGNTLGLKEIDIHNSFLALGGDSIIALKVTHEVNERFGLSTKTIALLRNPVFCDYADVIEQEYQKNTESKKEYQIQGIPEEEYYPIVDSEKMVFVQEQFENIGLAYHIPMTMTLKGKVEKERIKRAFEQVIRKNEGLRTSYHFVDGDIKKKIENIDTLEMGEHKINSNEKVDYLSSLRTFDLGQAPLMHVDYFEFSEEECIILLDLHHIVVDGISTGVIIKEFMRAYDGFQIEDKRIQFKDYAAWRNDRVQKGLLDEQKQFWMEQLEKECPKLEMPLDYPRGDARKFTGNTVEFKVSSEQAKSLREYIRNKNFTVSNALMAIYSLVLSKFSGQEEVVVGLVTSGRTNYEVFDIVGMFNNYAPVRVELDKNDSLDSYVYKTNDKVLKVYDNQDFSYELMLELTDIKTEKSRNPIFDTVFIFHNEFNADKLQCKDMSVELKQINTKTSKLDLKIDIFEESEGGFQCMLEYSTALFKEETMQYFGECFVDAIQLFENSSDTCLDEIELVTKEKEEQFKKARLLNYEKGEKKIAVTATFTSEPIGDYIKWWLKQFNVNSMVQFASYNQVMQELLDDKSLISTNNGINVILIRFEDWIRNGNKPDSELCIDLDRNYFEIVDVLKNKKREVPYLVGIFPVSTHLKLSYEVTSKIEELSRNWKRELEEMPNVYMVDFSENQSAYNISQVFDPVKDDIGHMPFTNEFYGSMGAETARMICAIYFDSKFKVIALDLDNTVWEGICGEVGATGVKVGTPFLELQKFMLECKNKGMLLVMCSKNNEEDVWETFEQHPEMLLTEEDFVSYRINWQPKSQNLKEMAEELNIGIDSFIFLDDSATECAEVISNLPQVLTLKLPESYEEYPVFLRHAWCFDKVNVTETDVLRTQMYLSEKERKQVKDTTQSMESYLTNLNLLMAVEEMNEDNVGRASQLTQRTNQFNLSTIRRTEKQLRELMLKEDTKCLIIDVSDRFGDYGIVGFVILKKQDRKLFFDTFILSCRVLGRGIEDAILEYVIKHYATETGMQLNATYIMTEKNKPFLEFLNRTGWNQIQIKDDKEYQFEKVAATFELDTKHITIQEEKVQVKKEEKMTVVLDHIALAVQSLEETASLLQKLGYYSGAAVKDTLQNAKLQMCYKEGYASIELVAAVNEQSPCYYLVQKNGDCPYHLCYRVKNIADFLAYLDNQKIKYEMISDKKAAILFHNQEVCFITVKGCGLIELLEVPDLQPEEMGEHRGVNDTIQLVTGDLKLAINFYKAIGCYVTSNTREENDTVIQLKDDYSNTCISFLSPQNKESKNFSFLQKHGDTVISIGVVLHNFNEEKEKLTVAHEEVDADSMLKLEINKYFYFYQNPDVQKENERTWNLNLPNYHSINSYEYVLPLKYSNGTEIRKIPVYEVADTQIIKSEYVAPRNEAEEMIAQVWQEVLGCEKVGMNDNFFQIGGNSIKGVHIVSMLTMDFEIHLNDIFKYNTIAVLAQNIEFKKNHFKYNLNKMKETAKQNQLREYTDDEICVRKYEVYKKEVEKYEYLEMDALHEYQRILFLGATGYLGSHILKEMLDTYLGEFHLLLRGNSVEEAKDRIQEKLLFYYDKDIYQKYSDRLVIHLGNMSEENLGLPLEEYELLSRSIDCIVNSAANVKHYGEYEQFYKSNVAGVANMLEFAKVGNFKHIHHISTVNVAHGKIQDIDNFVFTEYDYDVGQQEENFYIKTKFEAEILLVKARQEGLMTNIYRVGNLVFNTETNKFQKNIEDNAFYTLIKSFIGIKSIPGFERDVLDFSYVNHIAKAISILLGKKNLWNETYHLYNPNKISFATLGRYLRKNGYDIEIANIDNFFDFMYNNYDNPLLKTHILNILVHGYIMGDINDTNFYIMCDKTKYILERIGFTWDNVGEDDVRNLVDYCRLIHFIE